MSFIDVLIPGVIGLLLLLWPRFAFLGSRVVPDAKKLRLIRVIAAGLLAVALSYFVMKE